jgi:hypothetical protein
MHIVVSQALYGTILSKLALGWIVRYIVRYLLLRSILPNSERPLDLLLDI